MQRTTYCFIIGICLSVFTGCAQDANDGFVSLFDGQSFAGWKIPEGSIGHWRVINGIIDYDGKSEAAGEDKHLWSEQSYRDFILKIDWRLMGFHGTRDIPIILPDGSLELDADGERKMITIDYAGDSGIYLRGNSKSQVNMWNWPIGSGEVYGYRNDPKQPPEVQKGVTPVKNMDHPIGEWNSFVITMVGDRLTVELNSEIIIENAQLPGVPEEGPLALQHHGDPVQFRNIHIKELK